MSLKSKKLILIVFLISLVIIQGKALATEEPSIAVMPFEEGDFSWNGWNRSEILNGITQLVTDELIREDDIRVIERTSIEEIITEQDFGQSGRIDSVTAAEIGKLLGADALIIGTLTRMNVGKKSGISIGPLSISSIKAEVVITGRVVDVNTGEIKASAKGIGEESDNSFSISDLQGISFGSQAFADSALGKSIEAAAKGFVEEITVQPQNLLKNKRNLLEGRVIKVIGDKLIINIGRDKNLSKNQIGDLIRKIEVEGLDEAVSMPIGKVQIFSIDKAATIVKILDTEENPKLGDTVRLEVE